MTTLLYILVLCAAPGQVDELQAQAAPGAVRRAASPGGFEEDVAANLAARRALIDQARTCPDEEWADMRERLIAGLDSENRGVRLACCQALSRRDPEALATSLLATLRDGSDPAGGALAAGALARVGGRLSRETRRFAAEVLAQRLEDLSRPCDRDHLVTALGNMADAATDHLMRIAADETLFPLVRSALPHAVASTGDTRAMPLLLSLHAGARSDGERVASVLALGQLARQIDQHGQPVGQAIATIRADFEQHPSAEVAAAAALALARAGYLGGGLDAASLFELVEDPVARKNALRAVLTSRMPLDGRQRQVIESYAQDRSASPVIRKIASALLAED